MGEDDGPLNIVITILSCRELLPKNLLSRDPFVKVKLENTTLHRTKYISKTLNPAFAREHDYAFILQITRAELLAAGALKFQVKDYDFFSGNDNLGYAMIQADFILEATGAPREFKITPPDSRRKKGVKNAGFLTIESHQAAINEIAYYGGVVPDEVKQPRMKKKAAKARSMSKRVKRDDPIAERKKFQLKRFDSKGPLTEAMKAAMKKGDLSQDGLHLNDKGFDQYAGRQVHVLVEILSCKGILMGDIASTDPFVKVKLGKKNIHKTKHLNSTLNPVFTKEHDNAFVFRTTAEDLRTNKGLTFKVKDYDFLTANDELGHIQVPSKHFLEPKGKTLEFKISPPFGRGRIFAGHMKILVREANFDTIRQFVNDENELANYPGARRSLLIEILSARGILMGDINSTDPYIKVKMGKKDIHKTKYISKTLNPVFTKAQENSFLLQVSPNELRESEGLTFKVKDYDFITSNDELGFVQVSAQRLLDAQGETMEFKITPPMSKFNLFAGHLSIRCREAVYGEIAYYGGVLPPGPPRKHTRKSEGKLAGIDEMKEDVTLDDDDDETTLGRESSLPSVATATFTDTEDGAGGVGSARGLAGVMEDDEVEEEPEPDYSMYNGDVRLYVQIVSARNLLKGDGTSSDPYVTVSMNGKELHETKFLSRTLNPVYSAATDSIYVLEIYVSDLLVSEGLEFHVKDHASGADLGSVGLSKDELTSFGPKSKKLKLIPPAGKDGVEAGTLTVRCRIEDIVPGASEKIHGGSGAAATGSMVGGRASLASDEPNSLGEVKMYLQIISCRGLIKGDGNSSDPFVAMMMGENELHRTKPVERSINPLYNASSASIGVVTKLVSDILLCDGVEFLVKDASLEGENDLLGSVKVNANLLGNFGEKSRKLKLVVPDGKEADSAGTITLRCRIEEVTPGAVENLAHGLMASALLQASERGVTEAAKADMPELMEESSVDTRSIATDFKSTTGEPRSARKLVDGTPEGITSPSADDVKLFVQIISCRGLAKGNGTSSSPFVTVTLAGEEVHRTKHLVNTLNPIYNAATNSIAVLPLSTTEILASTGLEFTVKDSGLNGEKDELGSVSIPPETVLEFGPKSRKLVLQPPKGKSGSVGFITVRCRLEDIAPVHGEPESPISLPAASGVAAETLAAKGQEVHELATIMSGQEVEPELLNPADDEVGEREIEPTVSVSEEEGGEEEVVSQDDHSSSYDDEEESDQTSLRSYHTGYESFATARGSHHPSADAKAPEGFGDLAYVDTSKEGKAYPTNRVIRHGQIVAVGPNTYIVPWEAAKDRSKSFSTRGHMIIVRKSYESELILINSVRLSKNGLMDLEKLGKVKDVIRLPNHDGIDDRFYQRRYSANVWSSKPKEELQPSSTDGQASLSSEKDALQSISPIVEEEQGSVASASMEGEDSVQQPEEDMEAIVETVLSQGSDLRDLSNVYVLAARKEHEDSVSPAGGQMIVVKKPNSEDLIIVNAVRLPPDGLEALETLGHVKYVIRIAAEKSEDDVFYQERYGALLWVKNPQDGHSAPKHPVQYTGNTSFPGEDLEEVEEEDSDIEMEIDLDDMIDDDEFESGRVVVEGYDVEDLEDHDASSSSDISM